MSRSWPTRPWSTPPYVARGEGGEQIMLELIEALQSHRELSDVAGLSYTQDGEARHNPLRGRLADLDELPFPDLEAIVGHEKLNTTPIMTSWGCPFACNFCSVTAMFGRKYRFRSAESVVAELKEKRPHRIFFYDDNMAADKRRLKLLLQLMLDEGLVIPWSAQVRTDVVRDPELLSLMQRTGCEVVYLGLESVSQETLDSFDKSQTVEDIERAIAVLHQYGICSHGMFVLGADTDTVQTVRDTVTFAKKNRIDTLMLNILTPLPGTPQFQEMQREDRIFDHRWHLYDAHHVVFEPRLMTPYELQKEVLRGYMRFYSLRTSPALHRHLPVHEAAPVPHLGLDHRARLAQGRAQQGFHQSPEAHVAATHTARRRAQRGARRARQLRRFGTASERRPAAPPPLTPGRTGAPARRPPQRRRSR